MRKLDRRHRTKLVVVQIVRKRLTGSYRYLEFNCRARIIPAQPLSANNFLVRQHPQFMLFFSRCTPSIHGALPNIELSAAAVHVANPLILVIYVVYFFQKRPYPLTANNNSLFIKEFKCSTRGADAHTQFIGYFRFIRQQSTRNPLPFRNPKQESFVNLHI